MLGELVLLAMGLFPDRPFAIEPATRSALNIARSAEDIAAQVATIRADIGAECFGSGYQIVACFTDSRQSVYQFTEAGHPAHPALYYRGRVSDTTGSQALEERGWYAGDPEAAAAFFSRAQESLIQPETTAP
ncbi:MAG: hypothetical protein ACWA5T_02190 [Parvularcula sp.]